MKHNQTISNNCKQVLHSTTY